MSDYQDLDLETRVKVLENVVWQLLQDRTDISMVDQQRRQAMEQHIKEVSSCLHNITDTYTYPMDQWGATANPCWDLGWENEEIGDFKRNVEPRREHEAKKQAIKDRLRA